MTPVLDRFVSYELFTTRQNVQIADGTLLAVVGIVVYM